MKAKKKASRTKRTESGVVFRAGLCTGFACAPKGLSVADVEREANAQSPTGITSRWRKSRCRKLEDGTKLPAPCLDDATRVHYLLEC